VGFGSITVNRGQRMNIPELACTFPPGHKHRCIIRTINFNWGTLKLNYCRIYVYADFDRNGNGQNDLYIAMTYFNNNDSITSGATRYYRSIQQFQ
jgi:hypothetical protein